MKQNTDSFELVAEGARENWLAAKAAADISSCIPLSKIPIEELEALHTMIEVEFRVRDSKEMGVDVHAAMVDDMVADLTEGWGDIG